MSKPTSRSENSENRLTPDQAVVVWETAASEGGQQPAQPDGKVTDLTHYRQGKAAEASGEEAFVTAWNVGRADEASGEPVKLIMVSSGFSVKRVPAGPQAMGANSHTLLSMAA